MLLPGGSCQTLGFCQGSPVWLGRGESPGWVVRRPALPPGPANDLLGVCPSLAISLFPTCANRSLDGLILRESASLWPRPGRVGILESGLGAGSVPPLTSCVTVGTSLTFPSIGFSICKILATSRHVVRIGGEVCKHSAHSRYLISSHNYHKLFTPQALLEGWSLEVKSSGIQD